MIWLQDVSNGHLSKSVYNLWSGSQSSNEESTQRATGTMLRAHPPHQSQAQDIGGMHARTPTGYASTSMEAVILPSRAKCATTSTSECVVTVI